MAAVKENIVAGIKISAIIYLIIVIIIVIDIVMSTKKVTLQIITLVSSTLPAIALLADGVNYLISAAALKLERDGINIKCQNDDCSKGRIIIRVKNNSKNVAKNVNALISTEEGYPGIEDELLLWLPSSESERPDTEVSIKPKHSRKLLIFEYERAQRAPGGYVIKVLSEGSVDKPRARLRLDFYTNFYTKYVFRIKVDGERVRSPLDIKLYITMNKLDAITSSKTMFKKAYINENVPNVARKVFNIVLRELGNDRGIAERAATLRRRILISKSSNIEGYLRIANGFETLYNELMNQFRLLAEYLGLVFGVSYEYAVYLALAKRWDELTPLIKSIRSRLLSLSRNDDVYIMTELLLNLIITDEEFRKKFSDWLTGGNIYDTLKYYVPNHLRPALAHLLNYGQITCKSACGINEEEKCSNQCCKNCKRILNALNGNENMVKKIASELDSVLRRHWVYEDWVGGSSEKSAPPALIKEIIDYVRNNEKPRDWGFFSRAVVELRLPTTSRLRFILILYDLLRAREEFERGSIDGAVKFVDLAEAHAVIGTAKFDPLSFISHFFDLFELFASDLKSKLKGSRRFEISDVVLELLRLYHYHVETNIAETWP